MQRVSFLGLVTLLTIRLCYAQSSEAAVKESSLPLYDVSEQLPVALDNNPNLKETVAPSTSPGPEDVNAASKQQEIDNIQVNNSDEGLINGNLTEDHGNSTDDIMSLDDEEVYSDACTGLIPLPQYWKIEPCSLFLEMVIFHLVVSVVVIIFIIMKIYRLIKWIKQRTMSYLDKDDCSYRFDSHFSAQPMPRTSIVRKYDSDETA